MRRTSFAVSLAALLAVSVVPTVSASAQQVAPSQFWNDLGDTVLTRLTREALEANLDVRMASARVQRARALRREAAFELAPVVTAAGGYARQRTASASFGFDVPDRDLWDAELRASWEIDVFGRIRSRVRGQGALHEASQEGLRDIQRLLAAELATAYYALRGAEERLGVAEQNAENQRGTVQYIRDLLEAGRGTAFDTERAQALLSSTLAGIPQLRSQAASARHRIAVLVGRSPAALGDALNSPGALPVLPDTLAGVSVELLRARPDVVAAERQLAAETAFVGAARAEYLPRLTIGGTAGFTANTLDSLGRSGSGRYLVGPMITWPAFNLGRVKAGVDAARATQLEARSRYELVLLLAEEEVATAYSDYAGARAQVDLLAEAAGASERAAELARLRFTEGVTDYLPVLDAERTVLAAQDRLAEGRTAAAMALVAVYRARGGQ
jgi:multidrug efflux system outer membrane protein